MEKDGHWTGEWETRPCCVFLVSVGGGESAVNYRRMAFACQFIFNIAFCDSTLLEGFTKVFKGIILLVSHVNILQTLCGNWLTVIAIKLSCIMFLLLRMYIM